MLFRSSILRQHARNNLHSSLRKYLDNKFNEHINKNTKKYFIDLLIIIRTDDDIKKAVNDWCTDQETAEKKYGHISEWDTSEVNDMSNLFRNKQNFNHITSYFRYKIRNQGEKPCRVMGSNLI